MIYFFFSSRRRHTRLQGDWSSDVCSSDLERSLQLNKNSAFAWLISAISCCYLGRPDEALDRLRNAWRLSPFDPLSFFFWGVAGFAEFLAGRYDEALVWLAKAL